MEQNKPKGSITNSDIDEERKRLSKNHGLFKIRTANECIEDAKSRPIPKMLFGEFWFEEEICFLFSDTGLGKSILSVQIADSIASGNPVLPFKMEATAQQVLYFDFELSDKQFETRYSEKYQYHYEFSDNFKRIEINDEFDEDDNVSFEAQIKIAIKNSIQQTEAKILIIDNLTFLSTDSEKAKEALSLMKTLKKFKKKYGLSILVLGHTPKIEDGKPISKNHLAGSKMLINFVDSAFAIGGSHQDPNFRYLKQMKERNCEKVYHGENVPLFTIVKSNSFLKLSFTDYVTEREHLKPVKDSDKEGLTNLVIDLHERGKSLREIEREVKGKASKTTISRWIKKHGTP